MSKRIVYSLENPPHYSKAHKCPSSVTAVYLLAPILAFIIWMLGQAFTPGA